MDNAPTAHTPLPGSPLILGLIGTLAFLNVYAPQSLLPLLASDFGSTPVQTGSLVGATTFAIALISPLSGIMADALGRKRVIVATFVLLTLPALLAVHAATLLQLNLARFAQGLLIPLVMVTCTAYAAEEYPASQVGRAITYYVTGTILGGFGGRFLSGLIVSASPGGTDWTWAFWLLVGSNLAGALLSAVLLRPARRFAPGHDLPTVVHNFKQHLANRALTGTLAVGFMLLFTLVSLFTYVVLYLARPPYLLGSAALGGVFAVYLLGVVFTPLSARLMARLGAPPTFAVGMGVGVIGLALTLCQPLALVVLGLALSSSGVFVGQAAAQNAVQASVKSGRSLASGLYNLSYYAGGAAATVLGGLAYTHFGWTGAVLSSGAAMLLALATGLHTWRTPPP